MKKGDTVMSCSNKLNQTEGKQTKKSTRVRLSKDVPTWKNRAVGIKKM